MRSNLIVALVAACLINSLCSAQADASVQVPSIQRTQGNMFLPEARKAPQDIPELQTAVEHFQKQEFDECMKLLEDARAKYSYLPSARLMLARIFIAHDQIPPGRILLEEVATDEPDYPGVYLTLGRLALAEGRLTDARLQFDCVDSLLDSGDWDEQQRKALQVEVHSGLAAVAEGRRQWELAEQHLRQWLSLEPRVPDARSRLGFVLFRQGRQEDALEELKRAAELDPTRDSAPVAMASLYARLGQVDEAKQWMERAVRSTPDDYRTHIAYANWLLQQGDVKTADLHARKAAALNPELPTAKLLCGFIARHLKDDETALRIFEALAGAFPDDAQISNQLVLVLIESTQKAQQQRALSLAERNAKEHADSSEAFATLAWVHYRLGDIRAAEQALVGTNQSLSKDAAYMKAQILARLNRPAEAITLLKQTVDGPALSGYVFRQDARRLLTNLESLENRPE